MMATMAESYLSFNLIEWLHWRTVSLDNVPSHIKETIETLKVNEDDNPIFIFRITNRNEWAIGIFKQEMSDLIKKIEGKTSFPIVYKLSKDDKRDL
jgi:hypothetical protein